MHGTDRRRIGLVLSLWLALAGCGAQQSTQQLPASAIAEAPAATAAPLATNVGSTPTTSGSRQSLRLATTTSTADSGLLEAILPAFEQQYHAQVEVVAVGTGQALKLGENGDADVVLVHARAREQAFVEQGFGTRRHDVMYNDFIIVGPSSDPAGVKNSSSAATAFAAIATAAAPFASRGDDSGTFTKEQSIWASTGMTPTAEMSWYKSLGQGMGETLIAANELDAYTLTDRGTFLATRASLPHLTIVLGGETIAENNDKALRNPYGVIPVNSDRHKGINTELAKQFAEWITSPATQEAIGQFGIEQYGQPLFYASAQAATQ